MANIIDQLKQHIYNDQDDAFITLLKASPNIDLDTIISYGTDYHKKVTLLQIAAWLGKFDCVVELVRHGVNIDFENSNKLTALYFATDYYRMLNDPAKIQSHYQIIKYLIESGANCNIQGTSLDWSPLMNICVRTDIHPRNEYGEELIKLFIDHGADANHIKTAETYLRENHHDKWVNFIRDYQQIPTKGCYGPSD